ncbi:RnfABCDGE type electron transport complex subunit D [Eubacteriales bacterium OttesenSCG-928-N13]|nr:RnfABCDGE type electron transport complex subunit D [Eubacteriales bacterium OttesenSCG-928-N13]
MQPTKPLMRVTSSPHIRASQTTRSVMLEVIIALLPAGAFGVWHFGWTALELILISVVSAVLWEALIQRAMKKPITVTDLSAVVTGLLLAYNLPASAPPWMVVIGTGIAIVLVKQIFGGLGQNFMNPALAARAILMASWMGLMTGSAFDMAGAAAQVDAVSSSTVDAISSATPLVALSAQVYPLKDLFLGHIPGCIGEVGKLYLLIGGVYLMIRKVIDWRIPLTILGSTFIFFWIHTGSITGPGDSALYQMLSGGLILGAFFMATDYATCPVTLWGRVIFALGVGLLTFVIRRFNPTYPEGTSYAILIMNLATPLIERVTRPRVYGEVRNHA